MQNLLNEVDLSGVTPLFLAVYTGHADVCQLLLDNGADPNIHTKKVSPLHICAERGFDEIARALLQKAPQLTNSVDEAGNTALHVACDWDQIKIIQIICMNSAPDIITLKNQEGKTAVDVAYESNT